jgi:hypothetical protein
MQAKRRKRLSVFGHGHSAPRRQFVAMRPFCGEQWIIRSMNSKLKIFAVLSAAFDVPIQFSNRRWPPAEAHGSN